MTAEDVCVAWGLLQPDASVEVMSIMVQIHGLQRMPASLIGKLHNLMSLVQRQRTYPI